jgi:glycogen(starch) synthase
MKILLASYVFSPCIGGIETSSLDLARAFLRLGHEVQILTHIASNNPDDDKGLKVIRRPGIRELFRAVNWCDVLFHNNISLHTAWPLIFIRRPWVVCTQTWLQNIDGSIGTGARLKRQALRYATNVYVSPAVRDHVAYAGSLIPCPYDSLTFRLMPEIKRERNLVFLGRLVSDKGCDVLIESLAMLRRRGFEPHLTIIGSGSEEGVLKEMVAEEKLDEQVRFVGALKGEELAKELTRHQVMIVPSRWEEPFGIVTLEGIACGCFVVASESGGLPQAIGPCGMTFENENSADLAQAIQKAFEKRELLQRSPEIISNHLNRHHVDVIAHQYLEIFNSLCPKNQQQPGFQAIKNQAP